MALEIGDITVFKLKIHELSASKAFSSDWTIVYSWVDETLSTFFKGSFFFLIGDTFSSSFGLGIRFNLIFNYLKYSFSSSGVTYSPTACNIKSRKFFPWL